MNKKLMKILKEMCKRVGADYAKIDFQSPKWFLQYSWTAKQNKEFIQWLANEFYRDKRLFRFFNITLTHTKKNCLSMASEFVSNFGWKIQ